MRTKVGIYLDSITDRLSELLLVAGAVLGAQAPISAIIVLLGSLALLASRVFNHLRGLNSDAAIFGRPERIMLLVAGLMVSEPYGTVLFITAGICCIVSSVQVILSGVAQEKPAFS